jgi:hypothetical protein
MNVLETDHWCLLLPPEWRADNDDDVVRIVDTDEVGELEITTLCKATGSVTAEEVASMAHGESPEVPKWTPATIGAFSGVCGIFQEDDAHIREWYVAAGQVLLYITYICDVSDAGMDDAAIDDILSTLVVGDANTAAG